jgi:hypothetical protein
LIDTGVPFQNGWIIAPASCIPIVPIEWFCGSGGGRITIHPSWRTMTTTRRRRFFFDKMLLPMMKIALGVFIPSMIANWNWHIARLLYRIKRMICHHRPSTKNRFLP